MRVLDKSAFDVRVPIISAKVEIGRIGQLKSHPLLRGCVIGYPRLEKLALLLTSTYFGLTQAADGPAQDERNRIGS